MEKISGIQKACGLARCAQIWPRTRILKSSSEAFGSRFMQGSGSALKASGHFFLTLAHGRSGQGLQRYRFRQLVNSLLRRFAQPGRVRLQHQTTIPKGTAHLTAVPRPGHSGLMVPSHDYKPSQPYNGPKSPSKQPWRVSDRAYATMTEEREEQW